MRLVALVTTIIFALDQATKLAVVWGLNLAERGVIEVWNPFLTFRMAWNTGVNFGLFGESSGFVRWIGGFESAPMQWIATHVSDIQRGLLIFIALAISLWVWFWVRKEGGSVWARVSAGLLIGGALGNVVDRLAYGAVADFLNMSCCGIENPYAFNVADITIFLGAVGLVIFTGKSGTAPPPRRRVEPRLRDKTP
jgi:signal peptidase II